MSPSLLSKEDESRILNKHLEIQELAPTYVGEYVTLRVQLEKAKTPQLILEVGSWTCRECGRTTELWQPRNEKKLISPKHCKMCGRRDGLSFNSNESAYVERQELSCTFKNTPIELYLNEDLCKHEGYEKGIYDVWGVLGVKSSSKQCNNYCMSDVIKITKIETENDEQKEDMPHVTRDDVSPDWRKEIIARDKHCIICGGEKHLEAHHIFGYKGHPDLRNNVDNGITLCQFCHQNYHSQYGVKNPNPVTLVKFVQQFK